ncbi:proteasome subunit beta [Candidatus Woesearchaeota archaeon]|nr:proteasome subunit beta [Candidatus Woesearchaeota archaeon]
MESINVKKGTTTVGLACKDGIVLAADKRATVGYLIADKKSQKILQVTDKIALTMAGTVSDAQLLYKLIKAELKLKQLRTDRESNVKESANLLSGMIYGNIRKFSIIPGISHFLLGGVDSEGFHLYDLFADGSVTEIDDYVSTGSGSVMAYGVLEALYKKDLTVKEGLQLAVKAINAAISRDTATGEGIDVVTITSEGVKTALERRIDTTVRV